MKDLLNNKLWRLNNLYKIINKQGQLETFKLNWAQAQVFKDLHTLNLILKARQLGLSTFCCIFILDECLFTPHTTAGIIAHTREDAEYLFKRIKLAYDHLPCVDTSEGIIDLKQVFQAKSDSARELSFTNNSLIRVGTSMRSSTLNILHISEFGKICAQFPSKAEEIVSGSLNTIAHGQRIFIESTAEGTSGYFKDMCAVAEESLISLKPLSQAEFKFFFFPWWKHPEYQLNISTYEPPRLQEYFEQLKSKGIILTEYQRSWYTSKYAIQKDAMLREYPSTPLEAFQASTELQYYARYLNEARDEKRIGHFPYDSVLPVHTAWDLGYFDAMTVIFWQVLPSGDIRILDFIETTGMSLTEVLRMVKQKPYIYGEHYVPHDARVHELSTGLTRLEVAYDLGFNMTLVDKIPVQDGIDLVKSTFSRLWFNESKTKELIDHLQNYCREWNTALGRPEERPRHDEHSHSADCLRYLCIAYRKNFAPYKAEEVERKLPPIFDTVNYPTSRYL